MGQHYFVFIFPNTSIDIIGEVTHTHTHRHNIENPQNREPTTVCMPHEFICSYETKILRLDI